MRPMTSEPAGALAGVRVLGGVVLTAVGWRGAIDATICDRAITRGPAVGLRSIGTRHRRASAARRDDAGVNALPGAARHRAGLRIAVDPLALLFENEGDGAALARYEPAVGGHRRDRFPGGVVEPRLEPEGAAVSRSWR